MSRPPLQLPALLRALRDHQVDWVLSGSTVLTLYGADIEPNDLDVVPALEPGNLRRLAGLLAELRAIPAHVPEWGPNLSLEQCRAWRPDPPTAEQLDHMFVTTLGMLDVPPTITGSYAELRPQATRLDLADVPIWVCDPAEVLSRLPERPRAKDRERANAYAVVRARLHADRRPAGLARFNERWDG